MTVMDPVDLVHLEKIPCSQTVWGPARLKFLPFQTNLFDNVSLSSSDSELSGPFSDVVYSKEFEGKRKAKQLYGKDLYEAFSFSSKFKSAMESIKKERRMDASNPIETNDEISGNFEFESSTARFDFKFLDFPDVGCGEGSEAEENKKEKNGIVDKKKSTKVCLEEDELFDTMSGYWRLLSGFDKFRISPPWYDAYAEGKEHWLQTKPIPKEVFENSREKCLNWLQNHFSK